MRKKQKSRILFCFLILWTVIRAGQPEELKAAVSEGEPCEIVIEMLTPVPNPDLHLVEEKINEITVPEIGCTVSFREVNFTQHETQIKHMASGSSHMDIIFCGYTTNPTDLKSSGIIIGLGELLNEYGEQLLSKCSRLIQGCYIEDDYYFVPGSLYPGKKNSILYNASVMEEYGVSLPEELEADYESVHSFLEAIHKSDYPGYGITVGDGFTIPMVTRYLESFGNSKQLSYGVLMDFEEGREIVDYYETEEFYNLCKALEDWNQKGYLNPTSLFEGTNLVHELSERISASVFSAVGVNGTQSFNTGDRFADLGLGEIGVSSDALSESGLAITSFCEYPEKCMELLNLIYTDYRLSNLMNYGIEGVHYEKIGRHIIRRCEEVENGIYRYRNQPVSYGDEALNYQYYPVTEEYYSNLSDYRIENSKVSSAFGYIFDSEPVRAQVAAVEKVIATYRPGLLAGIVDVEEMLPAFIRELKSAGIDEIIEENQKQFILWKNSEKTKIGHP